MMGWKLKPRLPAPDSFEECARVSYGEVLEVFYSLSYRMQVSRREKSVNGAGSDSSPSGREGLE